MSISFEAREVLAHLNALGYRNISAEQLKEFIKDLKKLIKYENRIGAISSSRQIYQPAASNEPDIFEKLHGNKTTSIKAKYSISENKNPIKTLSPRRERTPRKILKDKNSVGPPVTNRQSRSRPQSANTETVSTWEEGKSAQESGRRPKTPKSSRKSKSEATSLDRKENRMWIRPKISQPTVTKTKDPVQLYQFYKKEWEKFRQRLPGENDHSELRWQIRHKLLGGGTSRT